MLCVCFVCALVCFVCFVGVLCVCSLCVCFVSTLFTFQVFCFLLWPFSLVIRVLPLFFGGSFVSSCPLHPLLFIIITITAIETHAVSARVMPPYGHVDTAHRLPPPRWIGELAAKRPSVSFRMDSELAATRGH